MTTFRNQSLETGLHQPPANVSLSTQFLLSEFLKLVIHNCFKCNLKNCILSTYEEKVYILLAVKFFKDKLYETTSGFPLHLISYKTKSKS